MQRARVKERRDPPRSLDTASAPALGLSPPLVLAPSFLPYPALSLIPCLPILSRRLHSFSLSPSANQPILLLPQPSSQSVSHQSASPAQSSRAFLAFSLAPRAFPIALFSLVPPSLLLVLRCSFRLQLRPRPRLLLLLPLPLPLLLLLLPTPTLRYHVR